jgi:hypothetical protein
MKGSFDEMFKDPRKYETIDKSGEMWKIFEKEGREANI